MKVVSKIAFYVGLKNKVDQLVNCNLNIGNPGVGGTQYLFLLTVKKLNEFYGDNVALLLTDCDLKLKDSFIPSYNIGSEYDGIKYCEHNGITTLVLNANVLDKIDQNLLQTEINLLVWAHNTLTWKRQVIASNVDSVKKVICVSEAQFKNMKDTPCWSKCTYINNVFPLEFYNHATLSNHSEKKAVYVGSIMPQKGVHNLLQIWKYVEHNNSDAHLYIFGGANVWNVDSKLSKDGIADIYYNKIIQRKMKKLNHPENIHFMGAKGWYEIDKLITTCRVGIVNPSHYRRDETFCLSAIELEAHGIPVISRFRNDGLNSTILNGKTGFLKKTNYQIAKQIELLLNDENVSIEMGKNARNFVGDFIPEVELCKWMNIVTNDLNFKSKNYNIKFISKDGILLMHDFLLKLMYSITTGKLLDILKKKVNYNS